MLGNPIERAAFAKDLVAKSDTAPGDTLSEFDRAIVGSDSVIIRIPLRDPMEVRRHLSMIEETARQLRLRLERNATDRSHLFMVRGVIRALHKKLNAYRTPRKE